MPTLPHHPMIATSLTLGTPAAVAAELRALLPAFTQIEWVERTGSTNADLMEHARAAQGVLARPWLLGAHLQDHGRGRAGRRWQNRRGANLMFSCAFDVFMPARQLAALSPLAGIVACEALRQHITPDAAQHLAMKWPNDILWRQAKLAGILVESTRSGAARLSADHHVVIIGIGVNLDDARALSMSLDRRIADWAEIAESDVLASQASAAQVVAGIARAWYEALNEASAHGLGQLPARHAAVDALAGLPVDIIDNGQLRHTGIACGVSDTGELLLRNAQGQVSVSVGEVSARSSPVPRP